MPAIAPPAKILVTGANGFIAIWVVKDLLERGYSVRGTVRSEAKGTHLLKTFKSFVDAGKLQLVVVEDITTPGAFNEAVMGVDAIEHTASPFHLRSEDPNDYIAPAVKGTVGILESAANFAGTQLKRIVITSSCGAISNHEDIGVVTEEDWNEADIRLIKEKGKEASPLEKYRASKALGEKAAWDFYRKNRQSVSWDLVCINPSFVFGPSLHEVTLPEENNMSNAFFYNMVVSGKVDPASVEDFQSDCVDVRDTSLAHIRALEIEEAGNQRFINTGYGFIWQDFLDEVNNLWIPGVSVPVGKPGRGKDVKYKLRYSNDKSKEVLGLRYCSKHALAKSLIADMKEKGWLVSPKL